MAEAVENFQGTKILIDHHPNPADFTDYRLSVVEASSTAELIYEFILMMNDESAINKNIATGIYCGILTDTGSFAYGSTNYRAHYVAGEMIKAGADSIISPTSIGGLRMVADMVRPAMASFLETLLRDNMRGIRFEEIAVSNHCVGKTISDLKLKRYRDTILLAVKAKEDWIYNPTEDHTITPESILVVLTTPEDRQELEKNLTKK